MWGALNMNEGPPVINYFSDFTEGSSHLVAILVWSLGIYN